MKTPITPEALIEMGFQEESVNYFTFKINQDVEFEVDSTGGGYVIMSTHSHFHFTNATTIEDIKDLIRLFK